MPSKKIRNPVRYAVVGAGWFGQAAILPAFAAAKENSKLVAIVSGDAEKRAMLSADYGVPAHSYDQYEDLLASGDVDAVFIATPNSEHREHTLTAARHGVHVLCEKPLAATASEAEEMTVACNHAGVLLMTAYRLHFEKATLTAVETIRKGEIGDPRVLSSTFTMQVEADNSRLDAQLGGHPLLDIGIYCINAARYLFRDEPTEVMAVAASGNDPRFAEVPEMVSATLRFPGERLASFVCGFGQSKTSVLHLLGTKGDLRMDPAYSHKGQRKLVVTVDDRPREQEFPDTDQIAPEIVYFSDCILNGRQPEPDGWEGWIDLRIIDALQTSILKGMSVPLQPLPEKTRPDRKQQIVRPRKAEAELVNAAPPQAD